MTRISNGWADRATLILDRERHDEALATGLHECASDCPPPLASTAEANVSLARRVESFVQRTGELQAEELARFARHPERPLAQWQRIGSATRAIVDAARQYVRSVPGSAKEQDALTLLADAVQELDEIEAGE